MLTPVLLAFVLALGSDQTGDVSPLASSDQTGVAVPQLDIIAINDEMKQWLDVNVAPVANPFKRVETLVNLIFGPESLNLTYNNSRTKTAIETFESRNGNCMSFTCMFIGMARYLGISAYFQEVTNFPTWDRHGDVVVLNRHMNAMVRIDNVSSTLDFYPDADRKEQFTRVISDERAKAQFYNNLGAEHFQRNELDLAIAHFEKAIEIDPKVSFTWSNIGVAYLNKGWPDQAEAAYKKALDINDREYTAMSNLVRFYERTHQASKADEYRARAERFRNRNPYYHFALAEQAYEEGHYLEAIDHYKDAIRRKAKVHEFYFGLAKAYSQAGMHDKVAEQLKQAMHYAPDMFDVNRYSQKLHSMAKAQ